jgi:hypothetical protein
MGIHRLYEALIRRLGIKNVWAFVLVVAQKTWDLIADL